MKIVLITAPTFDPFTDSVSNASVNMLQNCGASVECTILKDTDATKEKFTEAINGEKPDLILINGHGEPGNVTGHNREILISTQDGDLDIYSGTIVYAISCHSALELGEALVSSNAKAYIGYTDFFEIYVDSSDETILKFFVDPANEVSLRLINNKTVEESLVASKELYEKNIRQMYASSNPIIASSRNLMLASLYKDYTSLCAKGNLAATI